MLSTPNEGHQGHGHSPDQWPSPPNDHLTVAVELSVSVASAAGALDISIKRTGAYLPTSKEVTLLLLRKETRSVQISTARIVEDSVGTDWREFQLSLA